jgi:ribosomal protein S1
MKLTGKVVGVEDFGAFVNIGAPKDGLVPVGQMARTRVNKPADLVKEGDEVTVWVTSVNRKENKIGLAMVEPPERDWSEIKRGQLVTGKVTRLEKFGAFVEFGAEREGMIHVSEISTGYLEHPSEMLKVGEEVEAKVIDVDARKKQIRLSMKAVEAETPAEEEAETPLLTPMEIAFQQAQKRDRRAGAQPGRPESGSSRAEQEEIYRRTIEQHTSKA